MKSSLRNTLLLAGLAALGVGAAVSPIRISGREIEFPATVSRAAFERELLGMGMPGYHLIVYKDGGAAMASLFRAEVTDAQVLDALEGLGAKPGDKLGMDVWDKRKDKDSKAPDEVIAGPPVEVLVRVAGKPGLLTLDQILQDPGGKGFDMRFGGHRANIPRWKSGCIVCLYSCPGSKVGNARYTVRDYVNDRTKFRVKPGVLPEDGTRVGIVFRLR